jgi:hypothetical protein
MIEVNKLKKRDEYLQQLIDFKDKDLIKVVTGIRRCGKSSLLKLMVEHLKTSGVGEDQIVEINFELHNFKKMTANELYYYVTKRRVWNKRMYLFFDEIQCVDGWEDVVNSFRVDFDCDIYITGSNAYLLSSEYSTYLAGRYVEIKMLPLSFSEFIYFYDFKIREIPDFVGGTKKQVFDKNGQRCDLSEIFNAYLTYGGMPGLADVGFDQEKAMTLLDGIFATVVIKDILSREKNRKGQKVTDPVLLRKIVLYLADNIGKNISVSTIGKMLVDDGMYDSKTERSIPGAHTLQNYVSGLLDSFIFYEIKRYDVKSKEYLRTLGKFYIVDVGFINYLLGFRNRDMNSTLENIVYFELLRRGYDVSIAKVDNLEVSFVATSQTEKFYVQVTESILGEEIRERTLLPLQKINDNYEKIILSLDNGPKVSYDGIKSINLIDWLLNK